MRNEFRKTEKRLYSYRRNLSLLEELRDKAGLLRNNGDVHVQNYSGRLKAGAVDADPVGAYVQRLLTLEHRIAVLEASTSPVTCLLEYLRSSPDAMHAHFLTILQAYYFSGTPASRLLEATGWNRSTFYSRRLSLIIMAAECFRFVVEEQD